MPIDWGEYLEYFVRYEGSTRNTPMPEEEREAIEGWVAGLLGLGEEDRRRAFGVASPPGAHAATVVRLAPGLEVGRAAALGSVDAASSRLAVRVAKAKVKGVHGFLQRRAQAGGPFNDLDSVQRVFSAGRFKDADGLERAFAVLEWVQGPTLEQLYTHEWPLCPLESAAAGQLLESLLLGLIVPIWARSRVGHGVLWDTRAANLVLREAEGSPPAVVLIDTGSLEDTQRPRPRKKREAALGRLRGLTARVLDGRLPRAKPRKRNQAPSDRSKRIVLRAWEASGLEPALHGLADEIGAAAEAKAAALSFLGMLS
jgi:hypothetical protein